MKKPVFIGIIVVVLICVFIGFTNREEKTCTHDYYLSDYVAPSSGSNGYNVFTCKKCGDSYREVVPSAGKQQAEEESNGGFGKSSRTVRLFDLPVYSKSENTVSFLEYVSDDTDTNGYRHSNCYMIAANSIRNGTYLRYDLAGEYSTLSGKIYQLRGNTGVMWLEFYDGDEFLFSTDKLNDENKSVEFEFDISGVEYLTVYAERESYIDGIWIIADQIEITK